MCLLWSTNWVSISQKTTFFMVTAVKISTLHMEEMRSSETSVFTRTTWHDIPEDGILHLQRWRSICRTVTQQQWNERPSTRTDHNLPVRVYLLYACRKQHRTTLSRQYNQYTTWLRTEQQGHRGSILGNGRVAFPWDPHPVSNERGISGSFTREKRPGSLAKK
jgi:hypothetical protein